jgi:hypothetical protein
MNKIISSYVFNKNNNGKTFYKLIDVSMIHNGYNFFKRLNVDKNDFNDEECGPNGIYFCSEHHLDQWICTQICSCRYDDGKYNIGRG